MSPSWFLQHLAHYTVVFDEWMDGEVGGHMDGLESMCEAMSPVGLLP